jgi:hypothetical protein
MKDNLFWVVLIVAVAKTVVVLGLIGLAIVALLKYLTS